MNAFATAMNVILANANLAVDALWFAGGTGPGVAVRVIRKSPDEITPFGAGRILSETTMLDARVADTPSPAPGALIRIGAEDFILQGEPELYSVLVTQPLVAAFPVGRLSLRALSLYRGSLRSTCRTNSSILWTSESKALTLAKRCMKIFSGRSTILGVSSWAFLRRDRRDLASIPGNPMQ